MRYPIFLCAIFWILSTIIWITSVNAYEFPPYEGLTLKIIGDISEDYTNNINYTNDEKQDDFRTMLALGLDLTYESKRRSLGFSGKGNRRIEFDDSDISNSSEKMTVFFNNAFSEYDRIKISNTFAHTQEPDRFSRDDYIACREKHKDYGYSTEEIDTACNEFESEFGRFRGRFDAYNNRLNFVYNRSISEHLNLNTNYAYTQYWSHEEGTRDSQQNALGADLNYSYSPATVFLLSYQYRISDYKDGDDISYQSIKTGITQYITKRLFFSGSIGGEFVSNSEDNISGTASVNAEMNEQTTGSIAYSQGVFISPHEEDTFRNWRISGRLTRLLLEDLEVFLTAFYGKGDFVSADETETLTGASFSLSYNFWSGKRGSRLYGNLGYTYSDIDSTDEARSYARTLVNSSITLAF